MVRRAAPRPSGSLAGAAARQVAFLRAVNVGGRGVVRMADVRTAFEAAGCSNVQTVIASGNVLFDAPAAGADALRSRIRRGLAVHLGAEPVVVYRTMRDVRRLVAAAPFGALVEDREVKLYVLFVAEKPARRPTFPRMLQKERLEAIGRHERDVLVVSRRKPNGMYGFPNNWIEAELGVVSTARSWSTVTKLAAK
jgi:uncharacterized protein (DUF1697 family)